MRKQGLLSLVLDSPRRGLPESFGHDDLGDQMLALGDVVPVELQSFSVE